MESWGKFLDPQNIPGDSQKNNGARFPQTTQKSGTSFKTGKETKAHVA